MLNLEAAEPDVLVLVGTQTGNSEVVADAIATHLGDMGFAAHVLDLAESVAEDLLDYKQAILVTCTWSNGTFPDNAVDWFEGLTGLAPDLSQLSCGVVGLGDRDYDPFYQTAAIRLRDALVSFGARCPVELHEIEGLPTAVRLDEARAWTERIASAFADATTDAC